MLLHYAAPRYVTATAVEPPAARGQPLRLVVAPELSLQDFAALLRADGLRVVDGPSAQQVWTVAAPPSLRGPDLQRSLAQWRADPRVRLLEPLPGGVAP